MIRPAALAALAALTIAMPAYAQDRTAQIDSIFSFATPATPGCAVGVSQRGKVVVNRAYGLANVERRAPLTRSSLFDIGSTQKQFTAASILLLVEEGRLSLSDDIRKHLPQLPDYGHTVTVDHLLTHTGGIRDWTGMLPMAPEGTDVVSLIHRQRGLDFVPGTAWSYSTSGFELAKEIVARVSGMTFAEFTRKRLFAPLGMTSSAYVPDIMQAGPNAALGYQKDGAGWKQYMRLGTNRGGGAIVSTVGDLVTWTDALASGKLGSFVTTKIKETARLANGRKLDYARGLRIESTPGGVVVSHSGGAAGFSTWMGHVPEHGLSVAVSCNFDPVSATALAARVSNVFLPPVDPQALARARAKAPVAAEGVDVAPRAGLYFDERTGEPMRLGVNNGRLMIANGPPLVPVSAERFRPPRPDMFFRSNDDFEMTFVSPDRIEIKSMEGQVTRYRRAQPWTPTAADLQAADGRYESTELGSVFEVVPGSDKLVLRFENAPDKSLELTPVERDTYMLRMMIVRFRRDASGKVTGFVYGNPVVRNLAFARLGDRKTAASASGAAARAPVASNSTAAPAAAGTAAPASAAPRLEGLAGEYEIAPGRTLTITLEGGRLHGQPQGGEKRALTHDSGTTFSAEGSGITLTFTVGSDGRATAAVMRQNGRERTLTKLR
jgi:CubicO group peptidase (beta-lactamase class C family)